MSEYKCSKRSEGGIRSSGAGVIGVCGLLELGTGDEICFLQKQQALLAAEHL